jgi:hypothetical protein
MASVASAEAKLILKYFGPISTASRNASQQAIQSSSEGGETEVLGRLFGSRSRPIPIPAVQARATDVAKAAPLVFATRTQAVSQPRSFEHLEVLSAMRLALGSKFENQGGKLASAMA